MAGCTSPAVTPQSASRGCWMSAAAPYPRATTTKAAARSISGGASRERKFRKAAASGSIRPIHTSFAAWAVAAPWRFGVAIADPSYEPGSISSGRAMDLPPWLEQLLLAAFPVPSPETTCPSADETIMPSAAISPNHLWLYPPMCQGGTLAPVIGTCHTLHLPDGSEIPASTKSTRSSTKSRSGRPGCKTPTAKSAAGRTRLRRRGALASRTKNKSGSAELARVSAKRRTSHPDLARVPERLRRGGPQDTVIRRPAPAPPRHCRPSDR